jgi:cell shape-determining protein MreC
MKQIHCRDCQQPICEHIQEWQKKAIDKLHRRNKLTDNLRREIEELKEKIKAYQINLNEMNKDNQELQHIIEQHRWDRI